MSKNASLNSKCITILVLSLLLVATFIIGYMVGGMRSEGQETIDTVTVVDFKWKTDTFEVEKPIPKYIEKLKVDTFYTKEGKDTIFKTEKKTYDTLLCQNQDSIQLKTTISGINVRIDSLQVLLKKQEKIITNTITIEKYIEKPKKFWNRFHIQPQVTSGYDFINHQWGIMGGIGVGIDIGGK